MLKRILLSVVCLSFPTSLVFAANPDDLNKLRELQQEVQDAPRTHMDLSNTDLRNYPFIPGKIDLQGANLSHCNLSGVDLSKMNLGGANLSYSDLSNARLNQVNLAEANLSHANLSNTQIMQSDLSNTDLSFANLSGAILQQAILLKANLTCSNLDHADLSKANFSQADISGASFVNTLTNEVIGYESVVQTSISCG